MFYINPGSISLQRISAGTGSASLGRTETIPAMLSHRKAHLEFRASKEESLLELLVDGKPLSQWKDVAGWVGKGSGILFYAQTDGAGVKISNMTLSEWDGKPGSESMTNTIASEDQLHLANRDKVSGKVTRLRDGKFEFKSNAASLEIPAARVTQIVLSSAATNVVQHAPWEIQASVAGGGRISLALESWNAEKLTGRNQSFGAVSLNPQSIRQIQFNLGKSKAELELGSPDDLIWEGHEK